MLKIDYIKQCYTLLFNFGNYFLLEKHPVLQILLQLNPICGFVLHDLCQE